MAKKSRQILGWKDPENAITICLKPWMLIILLLFAMSFLSHVVIKSSLKTNPPVQVQDPQQQQRPPGFDYFLLALQWPHAFCNIQESRTPCRLHPPNHKQFTVHGLWPQLNNGESPAYCSSRHSMTTDILSQFRSELRQYWPNLLRFGYWRFSDHIRFETGETVFWEQEWVKHGSCSSSKFSPEQYIRKTIDLAKRYDRRIGSKMAVAGIHPHGTTKYNYTDILNAVKVATGRDAMLYSEFNATGHRLLKEVRLCVRDDGVTLFDCNSSIFASS